MKDKRPLLILIAVAVLFGGTFAATQRSDGDPLTPSSTTTAVTFPTTATTAPAPAAPWEAGLERVNRIENELFAAPDAARVDEIMLPDCSCHGETRSRLQRMKANGQRVDGDNLVLEYPDLRTQISATEVEVFVAVSSRGRPLVDRNGEAIEASPTVERVPLLYILRLGSDNQWRILSRGPVPEQ